MDKEDVLNTHTMDCYSDIKNEILPFAAMWIDKENIMFSEICQTEKDKYFLLFVESKNKANK